MIDVRLKMRCIVLIPEPAPEPVIKALIYTIE